MKINESEIFIFYEASNINSNYSKIMFVYPVHWKLLHTKFLNNSASLIRDFGKVSELIRIAFGCM